MSTLSIAGDLRAKESGTAQDTLIGAESLEAQLRLLMGYHASHSTASTVQLYALYFGLSVGPDDSLFRLVMRKLTLNGKAAQIRESLEATLRAGGAVGESIEAMLYRSGLVGWS